MATKQVHTVPDAQGIGWRNVVDGQTTSRHHTKRAAVDAGRARAMALRAEHVIHTADGRISERNSYGSDPFPPRG